MSLMSPGLCVELCVWHQHGRGAGRRSGHEGDAVRGGHGDRPLHGADHAQHGDKEPGNIARLAQGM